MNKAVALRALTMANEVMGALGVRYWLDCGSLLGAVREGDILEHDQDVDFSCKDWQRHAEIAEVMTSAGFELLRTHGVPERGYQQTFRWRGVKVDVFYFYEGTARGPEPGTWWQASYDGKKLIESRFREEIVAATSPLTFQGITVPAPVEDEAMLTARYGDWTVPIRKWDWRTDPKCIVWDLSDVTVVIKSFMRPNLAVRAVESVRAAHPECSVIVVDDSDAPPSMEKSLRSLGAALIRLPYDVGLSAGRNAGVARVKTPVTLVMDDDMLITKETNVPAMLSLLEDADVVCGSMRQDGRIIRWEGRHDLTDDGGLVLRQLSDKSYKDHAGIRYADVDFGLNGLVARTAFLRAHPWDESLKLGEHTDFFLSIRNGGRVRFTPDSVFGHERESSPTYKQMRRRTEFRLLFFSKHGLRYHVGASGKRDEWTRKDQAALERYQRTHKIRPGRRPSMALKTPKQNDGNKAKFVTVQKRTFLNKRGKATTSVREGVSLFAIPGQQITLEEARKVGLATGGAMSDSGGITKSDDAPSDLKRANKATLQKEAADRGLDTEGTNKEILDRIEAYDEANETSE